MKKYILPIFAVFSIVLGSCNKDRGCYKLYDEVQPIYMTHEQIKASVKSLPPKTIENFGKFFISNNYIYLNEPDKGVHVINNSNPAAPFKIAFIQIVGCKDLWVKGNTLYADNLTDLIALDISNPTSITETARLENIFNQGYYEDPIEGYYVGSEPTGRKIKVSCQEDIYYYGGAPVQVYDGMYVAESASATANNSGGVSKAGSMTRFNVKNNTLYALDYSAMNVIDISSGLSKLSQIEVSWGIETLFSDNAFLYLGAQNGMSIFDISVANNPTLVSTYQHISSCDPVVVEGNYAFVTLRSGTECNGYTNQLEVIDISDKANPSQIAVYPMHNPHGLGIGSSNTLFICDGDQGLKVFDKSDVNAISSHMIASFSNIQATDVIPLANSLLMVGSDGLIQYDYRNLNNIQEISRITN